MFNITSLIKDHLANSLKVRSFLDLQFVWFCETFQIFILLFNDLLILKLDQLSLFFKILNNLAQTLFQQIDFCIQLFYLLILLILLHSYLLIGLDFLHQLRLQIWIISIELIGFLMHVLKLQFLKQSFIFKSLVLGLNISFNFWNIFFSITLSFGFQFFNVPVICILNFLFLLLHLKFAVLL